MKNWNCSFILEGTKPLSESKLTYCQSTSFQHILMKLLFRPQFVNSLWPSAAIWWHRCRSISAQVMACCLPSPSHYINQCWLIISEVLWHSPEGDFTENVKDFYPNSISPRGQWVNALWPSDAIWWQRCGSTTDGTKPLPDAILTYHQWDPVTFTWGQFHKRYLRHQLLELAWKWFI